METEVNVIEEVDLTDGEGDASVEDSSKKQ